MSKSNFKRIGDFIQLVDERNKDLSVDNLLGITVNKVFIPSVANTIGTDMSNYKIIKKNQFACSVMQVRRDKKMPVALLKDFDEAIISQAYPVFEVIDTNELLPEYLMMWFSRSEFDREACFYAVGGVRGSLEWEDFLDMQLPVPSIEKQREIVKEYNTIVDRITLNEKLNQKLEETAQALYKHWFVDFEFPNKNGEPYKSSGGEMIWNDELGKEIPAKWEMKPLSEFCKVKFSKRIFQSEYKENGIPFYRSKEIILKKEGKLISNELYISKKRYREIVDRFGKISKGDILLTAVGTIGVSYMVKDEGFYFKDGNLFWFKNFNRKSYNSYIYQWMQDECFLNILEEITFGSTQKVITTTALYLEDVICPPDRIVDYFDILAKGIYEKKDIQNLFTQKLFELKNLLLSKMTKVETEKED